MKKILFIAPHLSTGGLPQFLLKRIEILKDKIDIYCIEYENITGGVFVVQRNKIQNILKDKFYSLGENKKDEIINLIEKIDPDFVHLEEIPEYFLSDDISNIIYRNERRYKIFETTHDSSFSVISKRWFPDKFLFVSAFNAFRYSCFDIPYDIIEYPIDKKTRNKIESQKKLNLDPQSKHVVCVGLFTERKNQKYLFEIAGLINDEKILFHFLGNQADNFKHYWEPLLKNKPKNCVVWGERSDVDTFLEASDLFFFPSKGDRFNKELNPIAIKEAITYSIPMMLYDLDVYCGKYQNLQNLHFLTGEIETDKNKMIEILNMNEKPKLIEVLEFDKIKKMNNSHIKPFWTLDLNGKEVLRDLDKEHENFSHENYLKGLSDHYNYLWHEMFYNYSYDDNGCDYERMGCQIKEGDHVLDIGANIGVFAHRAEFRGAAKVYAFEPVTPTFNCLIKNRGPKTEVFKLAIGAVNEFRTFKLHTDINNLGGGTCDPDNNLIHKNIVFEEKVFVIDINKIFEELVDKVDFLKMDIEGSEFEALNAIKDEHLNKLRCLSAEFHCHTEVFEKFQNDFIKRMENLNFNHFVLYYGDGKCRTVSFWKKD